MKKNEKPCRAYDARELAAFCLQIALLLEAGMPVDSALGILAEDAAKNKEKLVRIADAVAGGTPLEAALRDANLFPLYLLQMTKIGRETGTLDVCMRRLSVHYEREDALKNAIRGAIVYPATMVLMLLSVLFVLLVKVIPVFERVYEQMGTSLSDTARGAVRAGSVITVACFVAFVLATLLFVVYQWLSRKGTNPLYRKIRNAIQKNSKIAKYTAARQFAEVLALALKSGLSMSEGFLLAADGIAREDVRETVRKGAEKLDEGVDFMEVLGELRLLTKLQIQMIAVGNRAGQLDEVLERIAKDNAEAAETAIETAVARLEPTLVIILSVSVGLILLAVMLPLIGMLAAMG